MNIREKRLKEEEDRIAQLEALAKQYIITAEKVNNKYFLQPFDRHISPLKRDFTLEKQILRNIV